MSPSPRRRACPERGQAAVPGPEPRDHEVLHPLLRPPRRLGQPLRHGAAAYPTVPDHARRSLQHGDCQQRFHPDRPVAQARHPRRHERGAPRVVRPAGATHRARPGRPAPGGRQPGEQRLDERPAQPGRLAEGGDDQASVVGAAGRHALRSITPTARAEVSRLLPEIAQRPASRRRSWRNRGRRVRATPPPWWVPRVAALWPVAQTAQAEASPPIAKRGSAGSLPPELT
mmetsp:Transcript_34754/g.97523  ORF Transcript_34754/g.97523 Transcript_34754/m.97523 type:complete len:229 (-) Transcript_34754:39-725(-)